MLTDHLPPARDSPREFDYGCGNKEIVYCAFRSDGTCFPPVIFTSRPPRDPDLPPWWHDGDPEHAAYVVYMPGVSCANTRCTVEWVQLMESPRGPAEWNFLAEPTELIIDRAPWHLTQDVTDVFHDKDIRSHLIPAAGGRWLNPCDQAINREFRREFVRLQQERGSHHKLSNIIEAYYSITEETVLGAWRHTGITTTEDATVVITRRSEEGYAAPKTRKESFAKYRRAWDGWASAHLRGRDDLRPGAAGPAMLHRSDDSGSYWTSWGMKANSAELQDE